MKSLKKFFKKTIVFTTIAATVFFSMGSAFLIPPLPANAEVDSTIIVTASNGSFNSSQDTAVKAGSAVKAIMKINIFTAAADKNLNAVNLAFSGTSFATTDLAALATGNASGVALYNDSGGSPTGSAITLISPAWSTNNVTLTLDAPIALTQGATTTLHVLIKTASAAVDGHQIIATLPNNTGGLAIGANTAGPATAFTANSLLIDAVAPTITSVEKVSYNIADVNFSEPVVSALALTTGNYTFNGSLTVSGVSQMNYTTFRVTATGGEVATSTATLTVSANITDSAGNANATTGAQSITTANKIKISEVSAFYNGENSEFIELYNAGMVGVDLNGYKIQYSAPASGTTWSDLATISTSIIVSPYKYFLFGTGAFDAYSPSVSSNATFTAGLLNSGGHIRIYNTNTGKELDKIGWGTAVNPEGAAATSSQISKSLERKAYGSSTANDLKSGGGQASMGNNWDTENNAFDFVLQSSPTPQNAASTAEYPTQGTTTTGGSGGPMINHMSVTMAPTGANLYLTAQIGDPMTPVDQIMAQALYMVGDSTPSNNTTGNYTVAYGAHQSNGYFQFTIPQATVDASTANGIYYYLKVISGSATKYMSASPSADAAGSVTAVAQNPFQVTVQNSTAWTKHNITGAVVDASNAVIASALISLEGTGYFATTTANGQFTLSNVKDDVYNLKVSKTGYYEGWFNNLFLNSDLNVGTTTLQTGTGGGASGDTTKPRINWTGPPDGMQGVPSGQTTFKIFMGFSKDLDSATFNSTNVYLTTDGSTPIASTVTYDNSLAAVKMAAGLPQDSYLGIVQAPASTGFTANTTYYLVLTGNVRDTAGNALEGNRPEGGHVISFSTGGNYMTGGGGSGGGSGSFNPTSASSWTGYGSGAMMQPFVMGTNPNDGAQNIVPNIKININFSDPMDSTSVSTEANIKLFKIDSLTGTKTTISVSSTLDTSKKIATVTPYVNLTAGKYRIVATGALKSATGVFMGNPTTGQNTNGYEQFQSAFEVGASTAIDITKPTVVATWPDNNATGIQVNPGQLTIQFSESMSPSTITANTITLKRNTTNITGSVNYDAMAHSASFAPSVILSPSTSYILTIAGDATATSSSVTDSVGNPLAANKVVTFTTSAASDTTAPQIMFAKGDEYSLAVTFTETMNAAKITDSVNWKNQF